MHKLRPTLWRTCRVIANEQRLRLLYALFEKDGQCVFELAGETGMSEAHASIHLRALNSRGLIRQHRRDMRLFCNTEANIEVESAKTLLNALRICHSENILLPVLIKQATAFTHPRRIEIIQTIPSSGITKDLLWEKTHISFSALSRHLNKLAERGFVKGGKNLYFKETPPDALSKALLQLTAKPE
jgi:DNA-binding MarR family transcriptional regulator